jgi:hypothetical protein
LSSGGNTGVTGFQPLLIPVTQTFGFIPDPQDSMNFVIDFSNFDNSNQYFDVKGTAFTLYVNSRNDENLTAQDAEELFLSSRGLFLAANGTFPITITYRDTASDTTVQPAIFTITDSGFTQNNGIYLASGIPEFVVNEFTELEIAFNVVSSDDFSGVTGTTGTTGPTGIAPELTRSILLSISTVQNNVTLEYELDFSPVNFNEDSNLINLGLAVIQIAINETQAGDAADAYALATSSYIVNGGRFPIGITFSSTDSNSGFIPVTYIVTGRSFQVDNSALATYNDVSLGVDIQANYEFAALAN